MLSECFHISFECLFYNNKSLHAINSKYCCILWPYMMMQRIALINWSVFEQSAAALFLSSS